MKATRTQKTGSGITTGTTKKGKETMKAINEFLADWKAKAKAFYQGLIERVKKSREQSEALREKLGYSHCIPGTPEHEEYYSFIEANDILYYKNNELNKTQKALVQDFYYQHKDLDKILDKEVEAKKADLIARVEKKGGKIIDGQFLRIGVDGNLNGYIICENGRVDVETIYAGGYNIQCLHYRVLVKFHPTPTDPEEGPDHEEKSQQKKERKGTMKAQTEVKRLPKTPATNKFENKVAKVEANPTPRKIENLSWVRYDIEDLECETVEKQMSYPKGSAKYQNYEMVIDKCNELYERIEDLEASIGGVSEAPVAKAIACPIEKDSTGPDKKEDRIKTESGYFENSKGVNLIDPWQIGESPWHEVGKGSGRATCRICGLKIAKGETAFKFGASFNDGGSYNPWQAVDCSIHESCCPDEYKKLFIPVVKASKLKTEDPEEKKPVGQWEVIQSAKTPGKGFSVDVERGLEEGRDSLRIEKEGEIITMEIDKRDSLQKNIDQILWILDPSEDESLDPWKETPEAPENDIVNESSISNILTCGSLETKSDYEEMIQDIIEDGNVSKEEAIKRIGDHFKFIPNAFKKPAKADQELARELSKPSFCPDCGSKDIKHVPNGPGGPAWVCSCGDIVPEDPRDQEIKVANGLQAVLIRDAMALLASKKDHISSDLEKQTIREMFDSASRAFALDCDNIAFKERQDHLQSITASHSQDHKVILNEGGTAEKRIMAEHIQIKDLWHVAQWLRELGDLQDKLEALIEESEDQEAEAEAEQKVLAKVGDLVSGEKACNQILEVWHLAHDLKKHIQNLG